MSGLEESDSHGIMANGTQLPFYDVLRLPHRVRNVKAEEVFVVSRINKDAILSMLFLVTHNCAMEFNQPIVQVDGRKLKCTDRHGRLLVSSIQNTHELVVPPRTEMAVLNRVTTRKLCPLGVIEGQTDRPPRKPKDQGQARGNEMPREKTAAMDICYQPLAPGYQIPRRTQTTAASQQNLSPALRHRLEHKRFLWRRVRALGGAIAPRIKMVEVNARTTIERLLEQASPVEQFAASEPDRQPP